MAKKTNVFLAPYLCRPCRQEAINNEITDPIVVIWFIALPRSKLAKREITKKIPIKIHLVWRMGYDPMM